MGDMGSQLIEVYQLAYSLWKAQKLPDAERTLQEFWSVSGVRSLRGMLLMAYILRDSRRYVSEVKVLQELLESFAQDADHRLLADAWSVLGSALRMLGESELSVAAFRQSAALEPQPEQKLVECSNALFSANAIENVSTDYMQELYGEYRSLLANLQVEPFPAVRWKHERIRIGYLSADLRDHAVGQFILPLFCQYDQSRFAVYAYALNRAQDKVTVVLREGATVWRDMAGCPWETVARQIRADEIDILVDLSGHTAGNALPVFAWRPAPVQISGIGYFNSTGLRETRGFLSDVYCADAEQSAYFTEPLLRLPHTHFCYQPFARFPALCELPYRRNGYITFGCFNNFAKVNDGMLRLWRQILAAVPESRLLLKHSLLGTEEGLAYTVRRFERLGMPLSRIEFRGFSADYLEQYRDMDIALDTSPYPGGLTTCEALYMGVPVVSLTGNRHGSRFGYSFLANLNLTELSAGSEVEYAELAVKLAADPELLQVLHQNLRHMMEKSPLMDAKGYMRELETLYCRLLAPDGK